jgi:hypothetical protein
MNPLDPFQIEAAAHLMRQRATILLLEFFDITYDDAANLGAKVGNHLKQLLTERADQLIGEEEETP